MRVTLKFVLDCSPDAAWQAVTSPAGMAATFGPLAKPVSLEPEGFPERWGPGAHAIELRAFGALPVARHLLDLAMDERDDGVRIFSDAGMPLTGPLTGIYDWRHRIAISPAPNGRALYRDRLDIGSGATALALWPALWAFWQWRGARLQRLGRMLPLA